jgi:hypothetical protein
MRIPVYILLVLILSVNASRAYTDARTGIAIEFVEEENMFPESWYEGEINGKAESLDPSEYTRTQSILDKALKKYPITFLQNNLKKIYVMKAVKFFGQVYGGTNSNDVVYISNNGESMGYTNAFVEQTFHHEFSSILLRKYYTSFDETSFKAANAEGFQYGSGGIDALINGESSQHFEAALNENGILCQYGGASVEEDFNTFTENLFLASPGFRELLTKYPRLDRKARIIVRFYKTLEPTFTWKYFEKISAE